MCLASAIRMHVLVGILGLCSPSWLGAQTEEDWQAAVLRGLYVRYLGSAPAESVPRRQQLDQVLRKVGLLLASSGATAVPSKDIAMLALLQSGELEPVPAGNDQRANPAITSVSPHQSLGVEGESKQQPRQPGPEDVIKGDEGLRQAQEQLAQLPLTERLVLTGDIATVLQAASVQGTPDLTSTVGRARLNLVLRALPESRKGYLGEGYFLVQLRAAGGPPDGSIVGGPLPFTSLNDIATDRSRFNESTSQGNLYIGRAFYQQRLELGNDYLVGRVGVIDLTDYFDTNLFANNEARQFVNSAFVNNAAYKAGISAPGFMAAYHRPIHHEWLEALVVRAGYAVSRIDRAFTSPVWSGELELQTRFHGRQGNWRIGASAANRADTGSLQGLHLSVDHWVADQVGVFGRYGVVSSGLGSLSFGPARQSYSGGVQVRFADREDRISAWSLGFSQTFGIPTGEPLASERVLETYYRWQWTRNISLTPDFQLVMGSGGRRTKGTQAVAAMRFNFSF
ncbi:MAG: carbohydrate porin [Acidobacteriota bacterium]